MELFISGNHSVYLIKGDIEREKERENFRDIMFNRSLISEFYKIYFLMKWDCCETVRVETLKFSSFSPLMF